MNDPRAGQDAERRAAVPVGAPSNGVGGGVSGSGVLSFPVFRQEGMDLVGGEGAVGELFQALGQVEAEVEAGALGAGQYGHDGGDGRTAVLGSQMHPVFAAQGDWSHGVLTRSARPAGSLAAVHLRCAPVHSSCYRFRAGRRMRRRTSAAIG